MNWKEQRLGKFTASEIHKLLGDGKVRETYILEKATEILTGEPVSDLSGMKALEWGKKHEKEAYLLFDSSGKGFLGETFFEYEKWAGGSPDGLFGNAAVEIKCPYNSTNHLANLQMETATDLLKLHKDYYAQIQFNMICTNSQCGIFISYDPRFIQAHQKLKILKIPKDDEFQKLILERLESAILQLKQLIK
jgi:hypothetical protein